MHDPFIIQSLQVSQRVLCDTKVDGGMVIDHLRINNLLLPVLMGGIFGGINWHWRRWYYHISFHPGDHYPRASVIKCQCDLQIPRYQQLIDGAQGHGLHLRFSTRCKYFKEVLVLFGWQTVIWGFARPRYMFCDLQSCNGTQSLGVLSSHLVRPRLEVVEWNVVNMDGLRIL